MHNDTNGDPSRKPFVNFKWNFENNTDSLSECWHWHDGEYTATTVTANLVQSSRLHLHARLQLFDAVFQHSKLLPYLLHLSTCKRQAVRRRLQSDSESDHRTQDEYIDQRELGTHSNNLKT
jgi:hypothetical protein